MGNEMRNDLVAAMRQAVLATRAQKLVEATRIIRNALSGPLSTSEVDRNVRPTSSWTVIGHDAFGIEELEPFDENGPVKTSPMSMWTLTSAAPIAPAMPDARKAESGVRTSQRLKKPLGEVVKILRRGRMIAPKIDILPGLSPIKGRAPAPPVARGAQFLHRSFACSAGSRNYKLYVPASGGDQPLALILMLHGCKQDPDDFAAGTKMNSLAEVHGLIVAYPQQGQNSNPSSCWNWFSPADQMRDAGEPAILAGLTRDLMVEYGLDRKQVFVAGLSAGGAMAAVLGETYPELFSAIGVHSGLAYGSANDLLSAFVTMRGETTVSKSVVRATATGRQRLRTIVFQGSADQTVHPSNADRIFASASAHAEADGERRDFSRSIGGRNVTRTIIAGSDGTSVAEYWLIDGAGHAWIGGNPTGSFTDHRGPDASAEMVRFFLNATECPIPVV
jgi:poly(hydroxyalkanoate) depolymerase family esterase